ncbi:Zinc finger C2H2 [Penicillium subrubescens]|jgi:hypothetical protein|uniref:Zinc finger C2H2 n=1 Tax=Penicillium subrubescens TaxID=1316194 RepID=UPI0025457286|nr:Zinc finger C2H2 [Penicillium subrubescens]KAJ5900312.1 Zinc finger C2H2 [Penicillium subrubescens]
MPDNRTNTVSILIDDDHPSFSVRRNLGFGRSDTSQQPEEHPPVSDPVHLAVRFVRDTHYATARDPASH